MTFSKVLSATALLCAALFAVLFIYPAAIYLLFGLEQNYVADFMGRRAGAIFVGLGVLCMMIRDVRSPDAQRAVATGFAVLMGALALLGIVEVARGFAGPGLLVAVLAEIAFAAAFWRVR